MTAPRLRGDTRPSAPGLVLLAGVPFAVLLVASGHGKLSPAAWAVLICAVVLARLASAWPRAALVVLVVLGAAVPYYDGRYVTRALALTPVAALCLVALPAAVAGVRSVRMTSLDWVVIAYFLLRTLALVVNFGRGAGAAAGLLLSTALPFAVGRLLVSDAARALLAARATVVVGACLSIFALVEHAGGGNPFFTWTRPTYQAEQWARPEERLGSVRAEASFGHPIALGLFLVVVVTLGVTLYLHEARRLRALWLAGAGVSGVALVATLSRGPMAVGGLAVLALLVLSASRVDVRRLVVLGALVLAVSATTGVLSTVRDLRSSSATADSREALSAQYRFKVLDVALDPGEFSLLGKQEVLDNGRAGVTASTESRTGLKSVDSEFALVYLSAGLLTAVAYTGVVLLLLRACALRGLGMADRGWVLAVSAVALGSLTVALLTQQGELWWLAVGVVGGVLQRHRDGAPDA